MGPFFEANQDLCGTLTADHIGTMAGKEADANLIIDVTMDDLTDEQKHEIEQALQQYKDSCLQSYSMTRQGPVKKGKMPVPDCPGRSGTKDPADDADAFQQSIDQAVSQSLVSQTGVLAYEIQRNEAI